MGHYLSEMLEGTRCSSITEYLAKHQQEKIDLRERIYNLIEQNPVDINELMVNDKLVLWDKFYKTGLRNHLYTTEWNDAELAILKSHEKFSCPFTIYDIDYGRELVRLTEPKKFLDIFKFWKDIKYFEKAR